MYLIKVLIVDDYPTVREILRLFFYEFSPEIKVVAEAGNGFDAIEMVGKYKPNVILMDISMPVMDGIEATKIICSKWPGSIVITYTSYQNEDFKKMAKKAGAIEHILKPFDLKELSSKIIDCAGQYISETNKTG